MTSFSTLYRIELKRASTLTAIILFVLLTIMNAFIAYVSTRGTGPLSALDIVDSSLSTLLQLGLPILAVGIIAGDMKDHWLRSLLVRPVTRTDYLYARVLAIFTLYAAFVVFTAGPMVQMLAWATGRELQWNAMTMIPAAVLSMCQGMVVLMLAAGISVWLPGAMNIVVIGLWAIVSGTAAELLGSMYWDTAFIVYGVEFIFPSGFLDAKSAILSDREGVLQGVLWGIAALGAATAGTMWSLNVKTIETGSE